jgi:hypothetical protein
MLMPSDLIQLSTQFNEGKRFLVIGSGHAQLVESRDEAAQLTISSGPAIAFEVRELTSGNYETSSEPAATPYRKIGTPTRTPTRTPTYDELLNQIRQKY